MFLKTNHLVFTALTKNFATFGRSSLDSDCEGFTFNSDNFCHPDYGLNVISRQHFTISREEHSRRSMVNLSPAILECCSANAMYVNNKKLLKGDKKILLDGDLIQLEPKVPWFLFKQERVLDEQYPKKILDKFWIGNFIGEGSYGRIQVIHNLKTLEKQAIKIVTAEEDSYGDPKMKYLLSEVDLMRTMNHPNVMSLIKSYEIHDEQESHIVLIMELMDIDLLKYVRNSKQVSEEDARFFFYQITHGLEYLHSKNIAHRDLKAENVFMKLHPGSNENQLRIGDFGLSKYDPSDMFYSVVGTVQTTAPEIVRLISRKRKNSQSILESYTLKSDIWSLGCILYIMLEGKRPFRDDDYGQLKAKILTAQYETLNVSKFCRTIDVKLKDFSFQSSTNSQNLIRSLLQIDPDDRPKAVNILRFKWFNNADLKTRVKDFVTSLKLDSSYDTLNCETVKFISYLRPVKTPNFGCNSCKFSNFGCNSCKVSTH